MKITYKYVKEYVESYGYKLISQEYIRSNERLDMLCVNGHECSISWDNFKYGRRCKTCSNIMKANKFKLSYDYVREYISDKGCKLLSGEYINNNTDLIIKCACGNIFNRTFGRFKINNRCTKCKDKKSKKHTYEYIKNFIEKEGYTLLSDKYISCDHHIEVECNNNHKPYKVKFSNFYSGKRCPRCNGNYKPSIYEVKKEFEKEGYTLLDNEYVRQSNRLNIICDKGHKTKITLRDFRDGCRCNICRISKGEKKIMIFLENKNINYVYDEPYFKDLLSNAGNPLRPDFILPDYKIWIEYDGEFHFKKYYEDQKYDLQTYHDELKNNYAIKHNWKMVRIPYWEFENIENILNKIFNMK